MAPSIEHRYMVSLQVHAHRFKQSYRYISAVRCKGIRHKQPAEQDFVFIVRGIGTSEGIGRDQADRIRSIRGIGGHRVGIVTGLSIAEIPCIGSCSCCLVIEFDLTGRSVKPVDQGKGRYRCYMNGDGRINRILASKVVLDDEAYQVIAHGLVVETRILQNRRIFCHTWISKIPSPETDGSVCNRRGIPEHGRITRASCNIPETGYRQPVYPDGLGKRVLASEPVHAYQLHIEGIPGCIRMYRILQ